MEEAEAVIIRDARANNRFMIDNPIIDVYGSIIGPYGLALYLALCRHADKETQESYPRVKTLAKETGMSERQVHAKLEQLCALGLLKVESGKATGQRNVYILLQVYADPTKQREFAQALGYAPDTDRYAPRAEEYAPRAEGCERGAETSEQPLSTTSSNKHIEPECAASPSRAARAPAPKRARSPTQLAQDAMTQALAELLHHARDGPAFELLSTEAQANLRRTAKQWREADYAADDVRAYGEWWYKHDWRGEQRQLPTLKQFKDTWPAFLAWRAAHAHANGNGAKPPEPLPSRPRPVPAATVSAPLPGATLSLTDAWGALLGQFELQLGRAAFERHLRGACVLDLEGDTALVAVETRAQRDYWSERARDVARQLSDIAGAPLRVRFVAIDELQLTETAHGR